MKTVKNRYFWVFIICLISAILFIPACRQYSPADDEKQEITAVQTSEDQSQQQAEEAQKELEEQADTTIMEDTEPVKETSAENGEIIKKEETMEKLIIESPEFGNNEMIPSKFTCEGENVNPELKISGAGGNVKSLVLIMDDPDAPMGTWVHWTLWNIDPETAVILEESVPEGAVEGITSFRKPGYGGPCPPSGTHRYFFKLYALDTMLELDAKTTAGDIENAMEGHILDSAELIGLYKKIK